MSRTLTVSMTLLAMIAFAGNSLLCRLAMQHTSIDPASFTTIRLLSGALMLWLIVRMRDGMHGTAGSWPSALALFAYAAGFSYAYVSLPAATGALLLFGAVQATMIGYGLWAGERPGIRQSVGMVTAFCGPVPLLIASATILGGIALVVLVSQGSGSPDPR